MQAEFDREHRILGSDKDNRVTAACICAGRHLDIHDESTFSNQRKLALMYLVAAGHYDLVNENTQQFLSESVITECIRSRGKDC